MPLKEYIHNHIRLPGVLLSALLVTVLTISGLTFVAIQGQQAALEESRRSSQEDALKLLANRIEQGLMDEVQAPFRPLRRIRSVDIGETTFHSLLGKYTSINQILLVDAQLQLVSTHPQPLDTHDMNFNRRISERLQDEDVINKAKPYLPYTFVEKSKGREYLYAVEPIFHDADTPYRNFLEMSAPDNWIILRFDLASLEAKVIMPLFRNFIQAHSGHVNLISPDVAEDNKMTESLTRILPGWQLVYSPRGSEPRDKFSGQALLPIALAGGALLAITLTALTFWWEIRREHADVELRNRFIANVSHELKTPLSLIRMYTETLHLRRVHDPEKQQEYFSVILREAERLSRLIENVLDFSRLRAGEEIYHLTATDLYSTVKTVLEEYKPKFESAGLALDIILQDNLPPVAHDPSGITQIILNLLDNAEKYAAQEPHVQVRLTGDADWVDLQVIDFGPGLSPHQHTDLVRSLQKGRMARDIRGSGIGLAIVDMIAKQHNAHLVLDLPDDHAGLKVMVSFPSYKG